MLAKKFYWLKLKEDFFRDKRIKKLRRIAGGDTFTIIYLKLQLLSLQNEGVLIYEGVEETFAEEMALEIDEDIDNVKVTIAFLQSNGMLDEIEPNHYVMTETLKCIGSETASAERVRRHRELKNEQSKALQCNTDVTNCNIEIEIENKREEIEIENKREEIEIENKREEIEIDKEPNAEALDTELLDPKEVMFNEFWKVYPKKVNKKGCLTAYKRIKNLKNEHGLIINAVIKDKKSKQWTSDNGQYIPNPLTYINQERWKVTKEETLADKITNIDMEGWI